MVLIRSSQLNTLIFVPPLLIQSKESDGIRNVSTKGFVIKIFTFQKVYGVLYCKCQMSYIKFPWLLFLCLFIINKNVSFSFDWESIRSTTLIVWIWIFVTPFLLIHIFLSFREVSLSYIYKFMCYLLKLTFINF